MTDEHRSLARLPARGSRLLVQLVRMLRVAITAPFARALAWRRRTSSPGDAGTAGAQVAPAELATTPVQLPESLPARLARDFSPRFVSPEFECVVAEPAFSEQLFAQLQIGPRSKLFDLRAVEMIKLDLFQRLADAWKAQPGTVPRLGILLGYESWVVFHRVAARRLRPIVNRGVEVEIFYAQQYARQYVSAWFAGRRVDHPLRAVLEWLRTEWRATPIWPTVLDTTAMLVNSFAHRDQVPELLIGLAAIALSFGDADGGVEAAKHAQAALAWIGDKPSGARCRALRTLASATMRQGETDEALGLLESAITTAVVIQDRIEEASALAEIGLHALESRHFARAEARLRGAIAILSAADLPYLRATLHHHLAVALHEQRKNDDEAERNAATALALRWDKGSRLAGEDRALLARIRAQRPSQLS